MRSRCFDLFSYGERMSVEPGNSGEPNLPRKAGRSPQGTPSKFPGPDSSEERLRAGTREQTGSKLAQEGREKCTGDIISVPWSLHLWGEGDCDNQRTDRKNLILPGHAQKGPLRGQDHCASASTGLYIHTLVTHPVAALQTLLTLRTTPNSPKQSRPNCFLSLKIYRHKT